MRSVLMAALLVAPSVATAQETASDTLLTVNHYLDWEQVADPQVSPAGAQIIYTRRWVNQVEDRWDSALWIMNADGSRNRFLVKGSSARWSPDGTRIAYFADGEPKGTQVFVRWMDAEYGISKRPLLASWRSKSSISATCCATRRCVSSRSGSLAQITGIQRFCAGLNASALPLITRYSGTVSLSL